MRNEETSLIRQPPVTAKDIGRRLGLSQPTVSRILSGASGHRVSAETRRRVLEAAAEMGYRPNAVARSLRQRRTNIVGFYTGYGYLDARNVFLAAAIGGLQRACDANRLDLLLHGVFRGTSTEDVYGELVDGRIDGLFLHTHEGDPLASCLRESSLPVVALVDPVAGIPSVVCDDAAGMELLVDHLWRRGHRRIGFLAPSLGLTSVGLRREAFRAAMRARGAEPDAAPVIGIEFEDAGPALDVLSAPPHRLTAVCCWNDLAAYNLLYECRQRGVRVPEDLAVVGFDGHIDRRLMARRLVTVATPLNEVTARAMEVMVARIRARTGGDTEAADPELPMLSTLPVTMMDGDTA